MLIFWLGIGEGIRLKGGGDIPFLWRIFLLCKVAQLQDADFFGKALKWLYVKQSDYLGIFDCGMIPPFVLRLFDHTECKIWPVSAKNWRHWYLASLQLAYNIFQGYNYHCFNSLKLCKTAFRVKSWKLPPTADKCLKLFPNAVRTREGRDVFPGREGEPPFSHVMLRADAVLKGKL